MTANLASSLTDERRRSSIFVHRIPIEIIVDVFSYLVHTRRWCRDLVSAAAVCSRWRRIALQTPRLWTRINIFLHNHHWVGECLRRSRDLPLEVICHNDPEDTAHGILSLLAPHIDRIRTMEVHKIESMPRGRHKEWTADAALLLLRLTPEVLGPASGPKILEQYMPSLRTLHVHGSIVPWTSPMFHGLVHLHLLGQQSAPWATTKSVLDFLERCPNLETLRFRWAGQTCVSVVPENRVVVLPYLRLCYVTNVSPDVTAAVLSRLKLPQKLHLTINGDPPFPLMVPPLPLALHGYPLHFLTGLQTLELFLRMPVHVGRQSVQVRARPDADRPFDAPVLDVSFEFDRVMNCFTALRATLDLSDVRTLVLCGVREDASTNQWPGILGDMPRLHTLRFVDVSMYTAQKCLTVLARAPALCPLLAEFMFVKPPALNNTLRRLACVVVGPDFRALILRRSVVAGGALCLVELVEFGGWRKEELRELLGGGCHVEQGVKIIVDDVDLGAE